MTKNKYEGYQEFLTQDDNFRTLVRPLEQKDIKDSNLDLPRQEVKNYQVIHRINQGNQDETHIPLWLKRGYNQSFIRDEFTDYDVRAYYEYLLTKKYPQMAAFADYASVGIVEGADLLALRMAETIKNNKWGFYSYSTGGHWVLVVVSPDKELIILNSVGEGELGVRNINTQIQTDIISAFSKAGIEYKEVIYHGLGTQVGLQCGLHSVLAADEIMSSIINRNNQKFNQPEEIYNLLCLQKLRFAIEDGVIDRPASLLGNENKNLAERNIEILKRVKDVLPDDKKGELASLLENKSMKRSNYAEWYVKQKEEIKQLYNAKFEELKPEFSLRNILTKLNNNEDPIYEKPDQGKILDTRWKLSSQQFEDQRLNAFDFKIQANDIFASDGKLDDGKLLKLKNLREMYLNLTADTAIVTRDDFLKRVSSAGRDNTTQDNTTTFREFKESAAESLSDEDLIRLRDGSIDDFYERQLSKMKTYLQVKEIKDAGEFFGDENFKAELQSFGRFLESINQRIRVDLESINLETRIESIKNELENQAKQILEGWILKQTIDESNRESEMGCNRRSHVLVQSSREEGYQERLKNQNKVNVVYDTKEIGNLFENQNVKNAAQRSNLFMVKPRNVNNPQFTVTTSAKKQDIDFKTIITKCLNNNTASKKFNLTDEQVGAIILIAIKNGGIGNSKKSLFCDMQSLGDIFPENEINDIKKKAIEFSKAFQDEVKKNDIFTGNKNATSLTAMRLKRLHPEWAKLYLSDERYGELFAKLGMQNILDREKEVPSESPKNTSFVEQKNQYEKGSKN